MHTQFADALHAIGGFETPPTLAVAVSGGADSMALLLLTHAWAQKNNGKAIALTVDHGLRPEAKLEAEKVAQWCSARGIEHHTLTWKPPSPETTLQQEARDARYALLTKWCKAHGVKDLLTAHHRGDQAETLFFRLARGSTIRGLACMQNISELNGIRLVRPLLSFGKKELIEYLQQQKQEWIEDPSNQNMRYTRNSIRAQLQSLPDADDIEMRAANVASAFGRIRAKLDAKTAAAFHSTVILDRDSATIDATSFTNLPPEIALLMLAELIQKLTGDDHPPRTEKLERLYGWLKTPDHMRTTLAHLAFEYRPEKGYFSVTHAG